jgi:hypothetical protein
MTRPLEPRRRTSRTYARYRRPETSPRHPESSAGSSLPTPNGSRPQGVMRV